MTGCFTLIVVLLLFVFYGYASLSCNGFEKSVIVISWSYLFVTCNKNIPDVLLFVLKQLYYTLQIKNQPLATNYFPKFSYKNVMLKTFSADNRDHV